MPPGTTIIAELGEEHIRTGKPIVYTSADSVLQIAAHETYFGLDRLYEVCAIARRLVDPLNIGRVIARPFVGESTEDFVRTANRRDYAVPPPEPTLLDRIEASGHRVIGVGKIGDIFAHKGVTEVVKGPTNDALFDQLLSALDRARRRRPDLRQPRRFRHAPRSPPRCRWLCGGARGVRPAPA